MKAKRPTLRQRLVADLSKRIKLVRDPKGGWQIIRDGHMSTWASSGRDDMRESRRHSIQYEASSIMNRVRELRAQGFKVTLPS